MGKHWLRRRTAFALAASVTCAVLVQPGATAVASDVAPATVPDLFSFAAPSTSAPSNASALDVTISAGALGLGFSTPAKIATTAGSVVAVGLSSSGDLLLANATSGHWSVVDLSKSVRISQVAAVSAPIFDGAGSIHLVVTTSAGELIDVSGPSPTAGIWTTVDITTSATSPTSIGAPTALVEQSGAIDAFATTAAGDLFEYVTTDGRNWTALDLTDIAGGPLIAGSPSAIAAPIDAGLVSVFARTRSGGLIRYCNDNVGFRLWSTKALSVPKNQSMVGVLAVAATSLETVVSGTTNAGHLAAMTSTDGTTWNTTDLSVTLGITKAPIALGDPSMTSSGASVLLAYRSSTSMLIELSHTGGVWQSTNVSQQINTGELISSSPGLVAVTGGFVILAADGGPVPVIGRIVTLAVSQDQFHQKVIETPADSNCNPFTAFFGRGSSHSDTSAASCAKGTMSEEWCSDFAQWVWQKSGIDTTGINGWSYSFVDWGTAHGTFKKGAANHPKVGDALVWGNVASRRGDHVGIVVGVSGTMIDVVSGNAGPMDNGGFNVSVWRTGLFDPTKGDPSSMIVGYISPLGATGPLAHVTLPTMTAKALKTAIARQDRGR